METFEDRVRDMTISSRGLRPPWAGHVLAAIGHADAYGSYPDALTPEELGILHCLKLRVEYRADGPGGNEGLDYGGTFGLLGWALKIFLADPRISERQPEYRALADAFSRSIDDYHERQRAGGDDGKGAQ